MVEIMSQSPEDRLFSGPELETLKAWTAQELIRSGWEEEIRRLCQRVIDEKGAANIKTPDDLLNEIKVAGRARIPNSVKVDLLSHVKSLVNKH